MDCFQKIGLSSTETMMPDQYTEIRIGIKKLISRLIKAMFNERDQRITEAGPATPALILGLNGAPQAGDTFNVLDTEQEAREIANKRDRKSVV